jgi:hypothetical protein
MRKSLNILVVCCILSVGGVNAQGWVAEINIELNHILYAHEKITSATLTYSGITVSGSSETYGIQFVVRGTGDPSGALNIEASGLAWDPYDSNDPYNEPLAASLPVTYKTYCVTGFFETDGVTSEQQMYVSVNLYPRLTISDFFQNCDVTTLTSTTCSTLFLWEVSETLSGPYTIINGKTSSSISVTPDELHSLGLTSGYGRKYFRVTGKTGTTSPIQAIDVYYPGPSASFTVSPPSCHDGSDGSIDVAIQSSYPEGIDDYVVTVYKDVPPAGSFRQESVLNASSITISALAAGQYWLRIENNSNIEVYGNCYTDYKVQAIANPPKVSIASFETSAFNGYAISCKGGNDGTITASPRGGTGVYTDYLWTPKVSSTSYASNLTEGTYTLKVKDSKDCWSEAYSQILAAPEKLQLALTSTGGKGGFDVSCFDKTDGIIETSLMGGVFPYSYLWSTGVASSTLSGVGVGNYGITITDGNGCFASQSQTLSAPEPIDFTLAEIAGITCPNNSSGILEVQYPVNTIGPFTYSWSSGESSFQITDKPSGSYSIRIQDEQGCTASKSHTLHEPLSYSVDVIVTSDYNGSAIRCNGQANGELTAIVLDGESNVTSADYYTWYKNGAQFISGADHATIDSLAAGAYKVEVIYDTFCKTEKELVLDEPDPLSTIIHNVSDYHGFPISCKGSSDGSVMATATGGTGSAYTYFWSTGTTGAELAAVGAGTYSVTASDVNGCETTAEKVLGEPKPVNVFISVLSDFNGQAISCTNAADGKLSGSATGGTSSYTYVWNSGQTDPEVSNLNSGTYIFTATDLNGCSATADTTLADPLPVIATILNRSDFNSYGVACPGMSNGFLEAEGSGGTGTFQFTWTGTGSSAALHENLSAGTYTVTVSDQNACTSSVTGVITEPPELELTVANVKNVSCNDGADGEVELLGAGGAGSFSYSADGSMWQTASVIMGLEAGQQELFATDVNGCRVTTRVLLTEPSPIAITFHDIEPAYCGDARGKATASVSGGTGNYTYRWTDLEDKEIAAEAKLSGLSSGVYTLLIHDEQHCEAENAVGITSVDGPKVRITDIVSATCSYAADGSALAEVTDGYGPYSFLWQDGQLTAEGTNLKKGTYLVTVTDINECTAVESATIPAPDSLEIILLKKTEPLCNGNCNGELALAAVGGTESYNFSWRDSFSGDKRDSLCAGAYQISVTDAKGCYGSKTVDLIQPEPLTLALQLQESPLCFGDCTGLLQVRGSGGSGNIGYQWSTGATTSEINALCAGTYTATISDDNSCSATKTFVLENPLPDSINLGSSVTLCAGQSHTLDAGPGWQSQAWASNTGFTSFTRQITIDMPGFYWLQALSDKGCLVRDTFELKTASDLLKANFLMPSEAMAGDTVVMVDVSWPLPEEAVWILPDDMKHLQNYGDIVYGQFEKTGKYVVSLAVALGDCRDEISKSINVIMNKESVEEGRLGNTPFVTLFDLYPNPNEGEFAVVIELVKESPIALTAWNTLTAKKITEFRDRGGKSYLVRMNLRPLSAGTYSLRLDYENGTKYLRFIVR